MQSFAINAARAIQGGRRSGKVFAYRYPATQIKTPWHARHALAHVLNNWRRHREDVRSAKTLAARIDPYTSGVSFSGRSRRASFDARPGYKPLPATALLQFDWQVFGLIDPDEKPGPS
jgi:hypothetical protein